jgi:regulator of sirC expression with transglutaminase-like and TPR domain
MLRVKMAANPDLTMFAHVVNRPEGELDLAQAALLIAEQEYPALCVASYLERLDTLGAEARRRLEALTPAGPDQRDALAAARLECVVRMLFIDEGFAGNREDYYDPRNSFLNDVLDRKTGIPITLALVLTEVCDRAGVEARGVSFPNHFLVRAPGPGGPIFVDPFEGMVLDAEGLRALYARTTGDQGEPDARMLEPASKCQILIRILNNLRGVYASRQDRGRLRSVLERLDVLCPSEELRAQIEACGGEPATPATRRILFN